MKAKDAPPREFLENPLGSNKLKARGAFYWRDLYKSLVYPKYGPAEPIDTWYDEVQYGKINSNGMSLVLSESYLKQIPGIEDTIFALNFVADAFVDMRTELNRYDSENRISLVDSIFQEFEAAMGWVSPHQEFHLYSQKKYSAFVDNYLDSVKETKILNFRSFLKVFNEYISSHSGKIPFTRGAWLKSKYCSSLVSGMVIEYGRAGTKHGNDAVSAKIINDLNFNFVSRLAEKYGFRIDKNMPYRILADLNSKKMQDYAFKYFDTNKPKEIVREAFFDTSNIEIEHMKYQIWSWYNSYMRNNSTIAVPVYSECRKNTVYDIVFRDEIEDKKALEEIDDSVWVRMYAYIRANEENKKWDQEKFEQVVRAMIGYYKHRSPVVSMAYLEAQLRDGEMAQRLYVKETLTEKEVRDMLGFQMREKKIKSFSF
jgi:hypothetical protein